jgi:hypothetical protein
MLMGTSKNLYFVHFINVISIGYMLVFVKIRGFWRFPYVILENHIHIVAQSDNLSRGYVNLPEHWCHSSARYFMGQEIEIDI